jgi:hypothetical protein
MQNIFLKLFSFGAQYFPLNFYMLFEIIGNLVLYDDSLFLATTNTFYELDYHRIKA